MRVWNATEYWFLQCLVLGIRSSVGHPLYSNISLLSFLLFLRDSHLTVQECQSYFQFHNCNYLSQIWQRAYARFLILPWELHLRGPKPNCHNPGLGAPILYKLLLLPFNLFNLLSRGQEYKFLLRNPRVLLALVQTLLTCVFHLKSLVIVTQRYLMLSTFSRSVPSKVYEAWFCLIHFLVSCIILQ